MMNKYYEFIRLSDARKPWVFIKVSIMILKSSRVQLHSPQGPAEKKKQIWVLRNMNFCGPKTGAKIWYLIWGRLNKILKGGVKNKAEKWPHFRGQKRGPMFVVLGSVF